MPLSPAQLETMARQAEAAGDAAAAAKFRAKAAKLGAPAAAPAVTPPVVAPTAPVVQPPPQVRVAPEKPPAGPLAGSKYVGMTSEQISAAKKKEREDAAALQTLLAGKEPAPAPTAEPLGFLYRPGRQLMELAGAPAPVRKAPPQGTTAAAPRIEQRPDALPMRPPLPATEFPEIVPFQEGAPVTGRPTDIPGETFSLQRNLADLYAENLRYYINEEGYSAEEAKAKANADVQDVLAKRMSAEGEPTSRGFGGVGEMLGLGEVLPFFRQSRIPFTGEFKAAPEITVDGVTRPATGREQVREAMARQVVMTPEEAVKRRQMRAMERELAYQDIPGSMLYRPEFEEEVRKEVRERTDSFFEDLLTDIDPGTGEIIETPMGAGFRALGLVPTIVNEAVLGSLPLFYEVDDKGDPVDTNSFAFKANDLVTRSLERLGYSSKDAKDITSGVIGGSTVPTGIPVPFSPIKRASPTALDPTGFRAVSETETFLGDVALSLAKGRFLGDELSSIDGYTADLTRASFYNNNVEGSGDRLRDEPDALSQAATYFPLVLGMGAEMVYGIGPVSAAAKIGRGVGKAVGGGARLTRAAAEAASATGQAPAIINKATGIGELAGQAIAHPVETSKRVRNVRIIQDLMDGAPQQAELDLLMSASSAQKVASDIIAKDVLTPYTMVQGAFSGAVNTVGDLRRLAGDSKSGAAFLLDMGIDASLPDSAPFVRTMEMQDAFSRFRRTVHNQEIEAILANKDLTEQVKAARIFALLTGSFESGNITGPTTAQRYYDAMINTGRFGQKRSLDDLAEIAVLGNEAKMTAREAVDALSPPNLPYPQIRGGAPIYQSLHQFGEMLADQGRTIRTATDVPGALPRGVVPNIPLRGPMAEGYLRRIGGELPTPASIRANPEIYREAAIGAGSRAVKATLENIIPDDLVFVTSTLMVPRQKLTPEMIERVRTLTTAVEREAKIGPVVNGKKTVVYAWNATADEVIPLLGGPEAIRRSPLKQSVLAAIGKNEPLNPAQHQLLEDALLTEAYRKVFGEEAVEGIFAGAQTQQARVPTASLGVISKTLDTTGETLPRQERAFAEAREPSIFSLPFQGAAIGRNLIGSALVKAGKTFKSDALLSKAKWLDDVQFSQTPVALEDALKKAEAAVASIPDNFQREVRDAASAADYRKPNAAEEAFNKVLYRRMQQDAAQIEQSLAEQVVILEQQGMSRDEALSLLAYQSRAGTEQEALGKFIAAEGLVPDPGTAARKALYDQVAQDNWRSILKSFFGEETYDVVIGVDDQALLPFITTRVKQTGKPEAADLVLFRPIDTGNMREVLRIIRAANPNLQLRGAQVAKFPGGELLTQSKLGTGTDDAVFQTLAAWAMNKDKQAAVAKASQEIFDRNPWMVTDLVPSFSSAGGGYRAIKEIDAAVNARFAVLQELAQIGVPPGTAKTAGTKAQRDAMVRSFALGDDPRLTGGFPPGEPSRVFTTRRIKGTPMLVPGEAVSELERRLTEIERAYAEGAIPEQLKKDIADMRAAIEGQKDFLERAENNLRRLESLEDDLIQRADDAARDGNRQLADELNDRALRVQSEMMQVEADIADEQFTLISLMTDSNLLDEKKAAAMRAAVAVPPKGLLAQFAKAAEEPLGAKGVPGQRVRDLDNLTVRAYRNLNQNTRRKLVEDMYAQMLAEGTQNPDLLLHYADRLDDPKLNMLFFEKQATTQNIKKLIAQMDLDATSNGGRFPTQEEQALYDAIQRARQAPFTPATEVRPDPKGQLALFKTDPIATGPSNEAQRAIREDEVVEAMRKALLRNGMESFVLPAVEEAQQNLRAYGWAPDIAASRQDIIGLVSGLNPADGRFVIAGQDFVKQIQGLQVAARDGRLGTNIDALMKSDKLARALGGDKKAAAQYALQTLGQVFATPRAVAAGGMLAGGYYLYTTEDGTQFPIPAPNTRYLGMNISTLPFILATTLGARQALRFAPGMIGPSTQRAEVARQLFTSFPLAEAGLIPTQSAGTATDVLFTSQTGRNWTRAEFFEAVDRNSINITRGGLEFADSYAKDLARDAKLAANGVQAPALRQYLLRAADPTRTGIFQYIANATDRAVRQNVFASALKAGMTEQQAAQLARSAILDYGKSTYTRDLNKYVLFLAFREAMIRETLEALARDPDTLNRTILMHDRLSKQMDDELKADYERVRLPFPGTFVFDNSAASRVYGPVHPSLDMYSDAVQFAGWALQTRAKDMPPDIVAKAIADENLSPMINYVLAGLTTKSASGKGSKVPDEWVAYAIQNSPDALWPAWKEEFNIVPVTDPADMQPGRLRAAEKPGGPKVEYRFETPEDAAAFARYLAKLQLFGFERTTADYTKLGLTYGVSDFIDPKKRGLPSTFGFATGLETPLGEASPETTQMRAIRAQQKAAEAKKRGE
jgi:hypothetical protein